MIRKLILGAGAFLFICFLGVGFGIGIFGMQSAMACSPSKGDLEAKNVTLGSGAEADAYFAQFEAHPEILAEKKTNAAIIIQTARDKGLSDYAAKIGVATSLQEAGLLNLPYGTYDSLGTFQQRPGAWWGTEAEIMQVPHAADSFFTHMVERVPEWESLPMIEVALRVQIPDEQIYRSSWHWDQIATEIVEGAAGACGSGEWRSPLDHGTTTAGDFGPRFHPILHVWMPHDGTDFGAGEGEPIYAASSGVIDYIGPNGGYGNYVRIDHGNGVMTGYAHLSAFAGNIVDGSPVNIGDVIGEVGSTGRSSGAHLHLEVTVDGEFKDPVEFFNERGVDLTQPWK